MKALYKLRAQPLGEVLKGQDRQQYGQKNGRHVTEIEHVPTSLQFHADAAGPNDAEDRGHADVAFQDVLDVSEILGHDLGKYGEAQHL